MGPEAADSIEEPTSQEIPEYLPECHSAHGPFTLHTSVPASIANQSARTPI